jgi:indole-3-glycerol phosphate synthase
MNFLETIAAAKRDQVERRKVMTPTQRLEKSVYFDSPCVSLASYIRREDKFGVIAEIKRRSPSKGILNENISVEKLSIGYMQAGASALSILTEEEHFGGSDEDLSIARKFNYCPLLRKDFILDEYQIIESKSLGADAILLIAELLSPEEIASFAKLARSLSLEVLLETHSREALPDSLEDISVIGINHRDLTTFEVNLDLGHQLIPDLPSQIVKIAESGIGDVETAIGLKAAGFDGFLIGEQFMRSATPEQACAEFVKGLRASCGGFPAQQSTEATA